jgi:hypothetical protein
MSSRDLLSNSLKICAMRCSASHRSLWTVLATLLLLVVSVRAQNVRPVNDGDLSLLIIPKVTVVHGADSLLMKVEVTNIGKDIILLRADDLCLNPGSGLTLSVTDSSGHPLKTSVPLSCVPAANISERDAFVHLAPDAFYGRLVRIQASRIAPKPGIYELTFTLRATKSRREVGQILGTTPTPITAFTSNSTPLVFKLPIQIAQ